MLMKKNYKYICKGYKASDRVNDDDGDKIHDKDCNFKIEIVITWFFIFVFKKIRKTKKNNKKNPICLYIYVVFGIFNIFLK